jgi:hypothetical protein
VRAKVEHSIGVIKRVFGFAKVRYRGLKKNQRNEWIGRQNGTMLPLPALPGRGVG